MPGEDCRQQGTVAPTDVDDGPEAAKVIGSQKGGGHLAREIVTGDDTLWESLLAEARQQVRASDASDRARAAQELATAHDAVRAA